MRLSPQPDRAAIEAYMAKNDCGLHQAKRELRDAWTRNNLAIIKHELLHLSASEADRTSEVASCLHSLIELIELVNAMGG